MIESLIGHISYKVLSKLEKDPEFFSKEAGSRKNLIESLPKSFHAYFEIAKEDQFLKDLHQTIKIIRHEKGVEAIQSNQFAKSLANYLTGEVSQLLDRIPMVFYQMTVAQKRKYLEEKAKLPTVFVDTLSTKNYQQIFKEIYEYLKVINPSTPYIVVQIARDTDAEVKKEMRNKFKEAYGDVFPLFQVSKHLYGGMKVFVNGEVIDQSWVGKIERFVAQVNY